MTSRVVIEILEAKNLVAADSGGTSDPYCVVDIVGTKFRAKTKVIGKSLVPVWNEKFEFESVDILEKDRNTLRFELFDKDNFTDDFLGRCDVALETLLDGKTYHVWLKLKDIPSGELRIKVIRETMRDHKTAHKLSESIEAEFKKTGAKWEDREFPANDRALYKSGNGELKNVQWKRPSEIAKNPVLFLNGSEPGDVIQGALGDCYFLGGLSVVSTRDDLIKPLVVREKPDCGYYQFKFFKNGEWQIITIDDRIPCINKKPVYSHCKDENEMWVPLIEKAYAKLHGCYEALESGSIAAALTDLTGEGTQTFSFEDASIKKHIQAQKLWDDLKEYDQEKFLLGASRNDGGTTEEDTGKGILRNHAYGLLQCREPKSKKEKLIQLRNPWGRLEWTGKYSDKSNDWTKELITELSVTIDENDGTFWMNYEDFVEQYNQLIVLRLLTDNVGDVWQKQQFIGGWKDKTAGGSTNHPSWRNNPQYGLIVPEESKVFISLSQPDQRMMGGGKEYQTPMGMHLVKTDDCRYPKTFLTNDDIVTKISYTPGRDVSMSATLPKGHYVVFPSTFYPNQEIRFWLTFYTEKKSVRIHEIAPYKETITKGEWKGSTAGGCFNYNTWVNNPKYLISPSVSYSDPVPIVIVLRQPDASKLKYLGMYTGKWENQKIDRGLCKGSKPCLNAREVTMEYTMKPGDWPLYVVPHMFDANDEGTFELFVLSYLSVKIEPLHA